jgi:diguanylate cyclase (GGDEF)-like protein
MPDTELWSSPRFAEFVAAITAAPDEESATRHALEWATEALDAEVGVIVEKGEILASTGFLRGQVPPAFAQAIAEQSDVVSLAGIGACCVLSSRLGVQSAVDVVIARAGAGPFQRDDIRLVHAAARSLTLTLHLFRALSAERATRADLQRRQSLLERLASIQRAITRRLPLGEVLDAVTRGAADLLGTEVAAVRLLDPDAPSEMILMAHVGLPPTVAAARHRSNVHEGAGGQAILEDRMIVVNDYAQSRLAAGRLNGLKLERAIAAPVHDGDRVVGSITCVSTRTNLEFGPPEVEALSALAEHAGLAIVDARRVEHLHKLAFHDELTGLPNRGLFMERLAQALLRARRRSEFVAVLYLDLDRFKTINDSLGHTAGDQLLVSVGERLRKCLRDEDTASRLGGDEFAILAHCDRRGAVGIAERVLSAMKPAFALDAREVLTTASIGIALDHGGHSDADGMLRDSDTAMYRAKVERRGGFVVFEPSMHAAALVRMDLEADLHGAAARGEMQLAYQPIVNLSDMSTTGVEALVRWHHPRRGVMGPLDFIGLAEESGQIASLGRWIAQTACSQVREWQQLHPSVRGLVASVNLSPRQLQDSSIVSDIARVLDASGLDPADTVLEITEGAVMVDVETAIHRLHALRALGVSLAVDDFGTGHSSLALLRRLPVAIIKIDKMFVDTITTDATSAAFLETIVRMAQILSLKVVIEGIETAQQAEMVARLGAVAGQGYQLGRPMTAAAMGRVLSAAVAGRGDDAHLRTCAPVARPRLATLTPPSRRDRSSPLAS